MSVIHSICIVCSTSRRFKSRLKENENLPFLLNRLWPVFVKYLYLDLNETYEHCADILTFFNQVYEVPFCDQCRNDVAKLLVFHQKIKATEDNTLILSCIDRVVAKISAAIVMSAHNKIEGDEANFAEGRLLNSKIRRLRKYIFRRYNPVVNMTDCLIEYDDNAYVKSEPTPEAMEEDFQFEIEQEPVVHVDVEEDTKYGVLIDNGLEIAEVEDFETEQEIEPELSDGFKIVVVHGSVGEGFYEVGDDSILGILQGTEDLGNLGVEAEVDEEEDEDTYTIKGVQCKLCKIVVSNQDNLRKHLVKVHRVEMKLMEQQAETTDHIENAYKSPELTQNEVENDPLSIPVINHISSQRTATVMRKRVRQINRRRPVGRPPKIAPTPSLPNNRYGNYSNASKSRGGRAVKVIPGKVNGQSKSKSGKVKKHECDYCGKKFALKHHLTAHYTTHTGERPFKCSFCSRSFTQVGTVIIHERKHTGERPYPCLQCHPGKHFISKCALRSHEKHHHR